MQPGSDYIITPQALKEGLRRKKPAKVRRKEPTKLLNHSRGERRSQNFLQNSEELPRRSLQAPDSSRNLLKTTTPETIITTPPKPGPGPGPGPTGRQQKTLNSTTTSSSGTVKVTQTHTNKPSHSTKLHRGTELDARSDARAGAAAWRGAPSFHVGEQPPAAA